MKLENQNILIISNQPWGDVWYSKQNYAYKLSKLGNQVIFVDPPSPYQFKNLFFNQFTLKNYTDNLSILSYKNRLPASKFNVLNNQWVTKDLENYLLSNGIKEYILWTFDPVRLNDPIYFAKSCLALMDKNYFGNLVHHHKTLVYLAQGKPVFSVLCEAYQDLKDLMYLYDNHQELLHMFEKFLNNSEDPQLTQKRIDYAKKYSFENILRDASNILHKLTPHLS
jgi:hypothetical protein